MSISFRFFVSQVIFLLTFFILCSNVAYAISFSRTLTLGSQGPDVLALQVILNSDPYTKVAESGQGSSGYETDYFGPKTRTAVMNFQKKYAPETLFPAGIWQPTGVVGTYTRSKLNSLSSKVSTGDSIRSILPVSVQKAVPPLTALATSTKKAEKNIFSTLSEIFVTHRRPIIFNLSAYQASRGQSVTVNGSGFLATNNSIVFGGGLRIDNITSADGVKLLFTIPSFVPNGSYNIAVENINGTTFDESYGNFFTVTDSPIGPPSITVVEPAEILVSDIKTTTTITLTGQNFDTTNDIYSSLGNLYGVRSDGKTITFSIFSFENTKTLVDSLKAHPISFPVYIFVKNSHGVTQSPQKVIIDFK